MCTIVLGSLVLVFTTRVLLLTDLLPKKLEFTGKEQKYKALVEKIGKLLFYLLVHSNDFIVQLFTGNESSTLGSLNVKKQFDIWQREQNYFGKRVL